MVMAGLLSGCANIFGSGVDFEYAVMYPLRGPEYVLRDLGGNRYLLGQWSQGLQTNVGQRVRYYDRNTGVLSVLPDDVHVSRMGYVGDVRGAVRYESDSPLQIVFFNTRATHFSGYCDADPARRAVDETGQSRCTELDLVLSLDGGRSFAWQRVMIPSVFKVSPREYEFAIVRKNTLYLGIYADNINMPNDCCIGPDGNLITKSGIVYARRFNAETDSDHHFLGVVTLPLPANDGKPLPAAQIPKLSGSMLLNQALVDFDLGRPMKHLEQQPPQPPKLSIPASYDREARKAYIESLRADYPEWAAHQTADWLPRRTQYMSSQEIRALRAKLPAPDNDPVEWVRLDKEFLR